ncbi:golgi apyrase [Histoplasma ohiense]|nr:golgi apyrase [Histoplasma ohiense (nom. inval.)]
MGISRYAVVLDAGSSGTRAHVYKWPYSAMARKSASAKQLASLPEITTKDQWVKKIHPGISTFAENPETIGEEHLRPLLDHAQEVIPDEEISDTPVFLLATAGMRLLPKQKQRAILDNICAYIRRSTNFLIPDCRQHVQVIEGDTEGLYGWIAINYLMGGFDNSRAHNHGKGHHTYGFLDMGGASAQIAFAPNATETEKHANDLTLLRLRTLNGLPMEYGVFVTSWLGFGAREARSRYVKALLEATANEKNRARPDPCLHSGLRMAHDGTILPPAGPVPGVEPYLVGIGKFEECYRNTYPLLEKDAPCPEEPCLLHGVHVPAIDFDVNHFIGVSEFWHTTHQIFDMGHKDGTYDFNTYIKRVEEFCSQPWGVVEQKVDSKQWGNKVDKETACAVCFKASWLISILHDGIGIPRVSIENTPPGEQNGTDRELTQSKEKGYLDAFQAVHKIDSTEVSWTLGIAVLYASSQVPPLPNGLPVGFGSNPPVGSKNRIPEDFQQPGAPYLIPTPPPPSQSSNTQNNGTAAHPHASGIASSHWHDTLFNGHSSRRIPGLFLLIIVFIAIFFLCGRGVRVRLYRRLIKRSSHSPYYNHNHNYYRRRGGGATFSSKLFNHILPRIFSSTSLKRTNSFTASYDSLLETGGPDFEPSPSSSPTDDEAMSISLSMSIPPTVPNTPFTPAFTNTYSDDNNTNNILVRTKSTNSMYHHNHHHNNHNGNNNPCSTSGIGIGLGNPPGLDATAIISSLGNMDRHGLAVRTESRDRLAASTLGQTNNGRRSRAASPVRHH